MLFNVRLFAGLREAGMYHALPGAQLDAQSVPALNRCHTTGGVLCCFKRSVNCCVLGDDGVNVWGLRLERIEVGKCGVHACLCAAGT